VQTFEISRGAGRVWKVFAIREDRIESTSAIVDRIE
jgi:hypothetical protein